MATPVTTCSVMPDASATMTTMKSSLLLAAALLFSGRGAGPGVSPRTVRFHPRQTRRRGRPLRRSARRCLDKVIAKNPDNRVLLYERAMILIDAVRSTAPKPSSAGRRAQPTSTTRSASSAVSSSTAPERPRAHRRGARASAGRVQAQSRRPADRHDGLADPLSTGRTAEAEKVLATLLERAPDQRAHQLHTTRRC